jgi:hypothetical protein
MGKLRLNYIEEIKELRTSSKRVNLIKIFKLEHNENIFSDIIAELIKSSSGIKLLSALFETIGLKLFLNGGTNYFVFREYNRIDISIIFPEVKYIVGIENKILANEQEKQIARYQNIFQKYYAGYDGIFLFLTPNGRNAETVDIKSKFGCYNISYSNLLMALESIKSQDEVRDCVNQLIDVIMEDITMNDSTVKKIKKIWGNNENRYYLEKLIGNRPTILDIKEILTSKIETYLETNGDALDGEPAEYLDREITYFSKKINKKIPAWFVFYDHKDQLNSPFMRVVVYDNITKKRINELKKYNDEFAFEKILGKPWLSLYSGKVPNYVMNEDHDYGEKMAEIFFKAFVIWYNKIIFDIKNIK